MIHYRVVDAQTHQTIAEDVLATPLLISEGTQRPMEAFTVGSYRPETYPGGMWRARDDSRDKPGTEYRLVRIEAVDDGR